MENSKLISVVEKIVKDRGGHDYLEQWRLTKEEVVALSEFLHILRTLDKAEMPKEKLIKNKIANALHYYRNTKEPDIKKMVDNLYCLFIAALKDYSFLLTKYKLKAGVDKIWNCIIGNSTLIHKDIRQFESLDLAQAISKMINEG